MTLTQNFNTNYPYNNVVISVSYSAETELKKSFVTGSTQLGLNDALISFSKNLLEASKRLNQLSQNNRQKYPQLFLT